MNRERLVQTFMELVQIDSESKNEGPFQAALKQRLEELGLYVHEDDSQNRTGLGSGNLYARLYGQLEAEPIFFSCHVDPLHLEMVSNHPSREIESYRTAAQFSLQTTKPV